MIRFEDILDKVESYKPDFDEELLQKAYIFSAREHREPRLIAPLLHLTKADIIHRGTELGVDYGLTHSCYDPSPEGRPCGHCDSCLIRQQAFAQLGMIDPALQP